jgi:FdhD protein
MGDAAIHVRSTKVTAQTVAGHDRCIPEEVPVAFVYDGATYAVMMASPSDLEDFAVGFSLTEGIVASADEIQGLDIVRQSNGIELRMWLTHGRGRELVDRRRRLAGPTGCGLCGIESLEAAAPQCPRVSSTLVASPRDIAAALAALAPAQMLHQRTRAVHGAGFWSREKGLIALAEDVGRHNALDKLLGGLHGRQINPTSGVVLLTSRVSVEMVQKASVSGAPVIVAVSAPTALALKTADEAGITLIAVARADGFEVFTHPHRIEGLERETPQRKDMVEHAA